MTDRYSPSPNIGLRVSTKLQDGQSVVTATFYDENDDHASPAYPLGARELGYDGLYEKAGTLIDEAIERGQVLPETREALLHQFRSGCVMLLQGR